jgi:hypothetical protein
MIFLVFVMKFPYPDNFPIACRSRLYFSVEFPASYNEDGQTGKD